LIVFGHGIQDTDQFSHHCNQSNHLTFSPIEQLVIVSSQYRIMPNRYERRHKQSAADFFSSSAGHAFIGRDVVLLSHGCTKEKRVPKTEINRAIRNRDKYVQDIKAHTYVGEL